MSDNFDLRKYLVESKATINSKLIAEALDLGDVAFGELPDMVDLQGADEEEDTPAESKLLSTLLTWVIGDDNQAASTAELGSRLMQHKSDLFKLKRKFPEVFAVPAGYAFRGTRIDSSPGNIYNLLKQSKQIYIYSKGISSSIVVPYNYKPKSPVQSWSTELETAADFNQIANDYEWTQTCVLVAKIDDSFLMNPKAMDIIAREDRDLDEGETLHFGQDINTYLDINSANPNPLFAILYEVLEDKPTGTYSDKESDFVETVHEHPNFNSRCTVISSFDQLPW